MQYLIAMILSAAFLTSAHAQVQGADPDFVQKALSALQLQRNRAMDEAASAEAQLAKAQQQISDLQKQIDEMKQKEPPKK